MTFCLQEVMKTGTGRKLPVEGQIAAGKTGTTNDQKDGWFAGYTAYYTTAVWVGCDMPEAMEDLKGSTQSRATILRKSIFRRYESPTSGVSSSKSFHATVFFDTEIAYVTGISPE